MTLNCSAGFARLCGLSWLILIWLLSDDVSAEAEKRVALVIGNSAYQQVSTLTNPANDAKDISEVLARIGFEVTTGVDLDYNGMRLALRDFGEAAVGADVAVVYFAGHGIEIENTNYLIPVNAALKSDRDVEFEAIRLDSIVSAIADTPGLKLVLVDACRNNPFVVQMTRASATRSIGRGLAAVEPGGVVVGYAARGGTLAQDGDGRNSPYATALLEHLEEPGLEVGKLFRRVRDRVVELTDGFQEPFTYGSLPGEDIFLVPQVEQVALAVPPSPTSPTPALRGPMTQAAMIDAATKVNTMRGWSLVASKHRSASIAEPEVLGRMAEIAPGWLEDDGRLSLMEDFLLPGPQEKARVQEMLNAAGFDVGVPDGAFGPRTRAGIRALQTAEGLEPSGHVDVAVLASLGIVWQDGPDQSFISNPFAVSQSPEELVMLGEREEIVTVLRCLGLRRSVYGRFQGSFYIAMIHSGMLLEARRIAEGCGIDLAALTSAEENAFVVRMIAHDPAFFEVGYDSKTNTSYKSGPYFGFRKDQKEESAVIGWRWYSGEPVKYTNWLPTKPNRSHGNSSKAFAQFQYEQRGRRDLSAVVPSQWFDGSGSYVRSVILEGRLP